MLRQALNNITVNGIYAENDLKYITYEKDGKTQESIGGKIVVKVVQPINGVEKELMIPIHVFTNKYTKKGTPNSVYAQWETAMNDYVSIAASDEEHADRISVTGKLQMNEYYPTPDRLSSFPRVNGSFINKMRKGDKPIAYGEIEFCVADKCEEIVNDEPTGRILIKGIVPQYGGKVDVVTFIASPESPKVVDVVNNYWEEGSTVKAGIKLNFSSDTKEIIEEPDFGEPIVKTRTINVSELIISGGQQDPYEEDMAFSRDDIQAGLAERKARLEAQKAKDASKAKTKSAPAPTGKIDLGF